MPNKTKTDKALVDLLKKDDKKALTELYNSYWKPLFMTSYNLLKDKELCEEIVQDVFIDLWRNRKKLQITVSLQSYLYASTRYKVFAQFKKKKIERVDLFNDLKKRFQYTTPETKIIHKELVEQIERIVKTLPEKCKKVYRLSRDKNLSHKEIAKKLNISTKTVESHITNALKIIKNGLGYALSMDILLFLIQQ